MALFLFLPACGETRAGPGVPGLERAVCGEGTEPRITQVQTPGGITIWNGPEGGGYAEIGESIVIRGNGLCAHVHLTDTKTETLLLDAVELADDSIRTEIPWELPSVDIWIYFVTPKAYAGLECTILPLDASRRQFFLWSVDHRLL